MVWYIQHCYFLDLIHCSLFLNECTTFRDLVLLPSSGDSTYLLHPMEGANPNPSPPLPLGACVKISATVSLLYLLGLHSKDGCD
jgi:hypothetical protein